MKKAAYNNQQGFSLIEVSIVTTIVLLIAVIGIPTIGSYVVENKVPKVGQEITRFILQMRVNANTATTTPYQGVATSNLANMMVDSSVLSVGTDGTVRHGLGAQGDIRVEAVDGGMGFSVTLERVNHAACPSIASVLQRVAEKITVGQAVGAGQVVKDDTVLYSALAVESACARGDVNRFAFTSY